MEQVRWTDGNVVSPYDKDSKVYKCKNNQYKCKNTGKMFNVKTGTLFENTKIEFQKWFVAIFLITSLPKGTSISKRFKGDTQDSVVYVASH